MHAEIPQLNSELTTQASIGRQKNQNNSSMHRTQGRIFVCSATFHGLLVACQDSSPPSQRKDELEIGSVSQSACRDLVAVKLATESWHQSMNRLKVLLWCRGNWEVKLEEIQWGDKIGEGAMAAIYKAKLRCVF